MQKIKPNLPSVEKKTICASFTAMLIRIFGKVASSESGAGNEQHILACLIRHTQKLFFSLVEHQPSIHLVLSSSSPTQLPAACGRNTAQRRCSTQYMAARTATRPAGSSPSFSPTLGRPPKQSRMGRKSMWRGRWLLSGLTLPGRTEVGLKPKAQSQMLQSGSANISKVSL